MDETVNNTHTHTHNIAQRTQKHFKHNHVHANGPVVGRVILTGGHNQTSLTDYIVSKGILIILIIKVSWVRLSSGGEKEKPGGNKWKKTQSDYVKSKDETWV